MESLPETRIKSKKPNIFVRLISGIIPFKGDRPFEVIRKLIVLISLIAVGICLGFILSELDEDRRNNALYESLGEKRNPEVISLTPAQINEIKDEVPEIRDEFIELYSENNDLVGWIDISGTRINYPVMQYRREQPDGSITGNNEYYLNYDFYHKESRHGSIYADWRFPFTPTSRPDNMVIYGHNMRDGSMFEQASHYYTDHNKSGGTINFYRSNPLIHFDTLYETGVYKVFAAIYVHTDEEKYNDVFDYFRWREFPDKNTFYSFVVNVLDRSTFYTEVDLEYGDEILTLSTCYYQFGKNNLSSRVAVFARRVREGESSQVNVDAAFVNPGPLFFDYYYNNKGGSWGGRNWDTSKVSGLDDWLTERGNKEILIKYAQARME